MKLFLKQTPQLQEPEVEIRYAKADESIDALIQYISTLGLHISGEENGKTYKLKAASVYYIESVDKQVFIYTDTRVYSSSLRLYQLLEQLQDLCFVQISKTCALNLDMLESIQTLKNSRLEATLINGERLHVSRTYVPKIKLALDLSGERVKR